MATIGSLALAIRAKTDQLKRDLAPALSAIKEWGSAAVAAGADAKEVDRAMGRMRAEAMKGSDAMKGAGNAMEGGLRRAKVAASALTGAISAVSSEVGGSIGHVTRLGTSLTSAFLAGGPIALGVTALAAGISAIAGSSREAEEAAKKAREAHIKWMEDARSKTRSLAEALAETQDHLRALRLGAPELAGRFTADRKEAEALRNVLDEIADSQRRLSAAQKTADQITEQRAATGLLQLSGQLLADAEAIIRIEREKLTALGEQAQKLQEGSRAADERLRLEKDGEQSVKRTATYMERLRGLVKGVASDFDAGAAAARKMADEAQRIDIARNKELAGQIKSGMGIGAKGAPPKFSAEQLKSFDEMSRASQVEMVKRIEAAQKGKKAQTDLVTGLKRELDLLKLTTNEARERYMIQEKLNQRIKEAKGDEEAIALAKKISAIESAQLAEKEAQAAKEKAEAEAKATLEKVKQKGLMQEQLDITKRFANFGGTSAFGFGKGVIGTGMGAMNAPGGKVSYQGVTGPTGPSQGGAGVQGKGLNLPDLGPQFKALEAELAKIPPWYQRLADAVTSASAGTKQVVIELGQTTARATAALRRDQNQLAADVRALRRAIDRAGNGSGGGD